MQRYGIDTKKYEEKGDLVIQKGEEIFRDLVKPDVDYLRAQSIDVLLKHFTNKA